MQTATNLASKPAQFPPFDLERLLKTVFAPRQGERICILIDLENPNDIKNLNFLNRQDLPVQKKGYEVFFQGLQKGIAQKLGLSQCELFAYKMTGGSNLELPENAVSPDGKILNLHKDIFSHFDIILCITTYSATAPLTAAAKRFGFRGATMHGLNDIVLNSGLAVDYNEVSRFTEKLRKGMTKADNVEIDFEVKGKNYHLFIELGSQEAQKSHGICHASSDIANLPAGEVYFVPLDAKGQFPIKFEEGTIGLMDVSQGRVTDVSLIEGDKKTIADLKQKISTDPSAGILGELGFGTQVLPYSGADIQDEKIFGTFHLATGRNDHLSGPVTLDLFVYKQNATHDDILFSSTKTPEIQVKKVIMNRQGKKETLITNYEPSDYLWKLLK